MQKRNSFIGLSLITTILFIIALLLLDIFTKQIFSSKTYFKNSIIFIKYSINQGSAFNLFSNIIHYDYLMVLLSIVILLILIYKYNYFLKNKLLTSVYIFLFAGILGNTLDRLFLGYVRDFIGIKYLFIFNLADLYLALAVILFAIYEYSENKILKTKKNQI